MSALLRECEWRLQKWKQCWGYVPRNCANTVAVFFVRVVSLVPWLVLSILLPLATSKSSVQIRAKTRPTQMIHAKSGIGPPTCHQHVSNVFSVKCKKMRLKGFSRNIVETKSSVEVAPWNAQCVKGKQGGE
ncbi:unnamed protein product [Ixodes pacificus]